MLLEQVADEAEAVAVDAGGVDADEDVALLDQLRAPELVALGDADGEAGHVEVAVRELPRVLGGLAAEQDALGAHAALVDAGDDVGDLLGHDLADDEVVEEEERHGAAGGDVVDAHRDEVDADGVEPAHAARDLDLGAHAVGAGHEHRVLEARQAHGAAEPAEAAEDERVLRALEPLLHELDGAVARLDVDAGLLVREPLLVRHAAPRSVVRTVYVLPRPGRQCPGRFRGGGLDVPSSMGRGSSPAARVAAGDGSHRPAPRLVCAPVAAPRRRRALSAAADVAPRYDRTVKCDLVERLPEPPAARRSSGARGRSASSRRVAERLTGLPTFNFAVQNSRPEDAYAMARYLFWREPRVKLRCVWALQATTLTDSPLHPGLLAEPRLSQFLPGYLVDDQREAAVSSQGREMPVSDTSSRARGLLRAQRLRRAGSSAASPFETTLRELPVPRWCPGGRAHTLRADARQAGTSSARCRLFNLHDVEPVLVIMPYHPTALAAFRAVGWDAKEDAFKTYLESLRGAYRFRLLDYTDIAAFHGDEDAFYDGAHVKAANARRILAQAVKDAPEALR